jgi:long-chain acyl-CoA synthetase
MFLSHNNKVAINCGTQHIHYDELHSRIKFASQQYKVDKDDRVVIFSENRVGWIYAFYSIWLNHATVVPIDFMSTVTDVAHILSDCTPKIIIASSALQKVLSEAMTKSGIEAQVIDIEKFEANTDNLKFEGKVVINPDIKDRAVIVYTSGTTGKPKGVMLSYENLWVNVKAVSKY